MTTFLFIVLFISVGVLFLLVKGVLMALNVARKDIEQLSRVLNETEQRVLELEKSKK